MSKKKLCLKQMRPMLRCTSLYTPELQSLKCTSSSYIPRMSQVEILKLRFSAYTRTFNSNFDVDAECRISITKKLGPRLIGFVVRLRVHTSKRPTQIKALLTEVTEV